MKKAIFAVVAASSLTYAVSAVAQVQVPVEFQTQTTTQATAEEIQAYAQRLAAATTSADRTAIMNSIMAAHGDASMSDIMAAVDALVTDEQASVILQEMIAYLSETEGTEGEVAELVANNQMLLSMVGTDTQPAAGPTGQQGGNTAPDNLGNTTTNAGGEGNTNQVLENPNQVSNNQL